MEEMAGGSAEGVKSPSLSSNPTDGIPRRLLGELCFVASHCINAVSDHQFLYFFCVITNL